MSKEPAKRYVPKKRAAPAAHKAASAASTGRDRLLFDTMPFGIIFLDGKGVITRANAMAEQVLGSPAAPLAGRRFLDPSWNPLGEDGSPLPPDRHPLSCAADEPAGNAVVSVELPDRKERRWLRVAVLPVPRTARRAPEQAYAVFDDITDQRRAADELSCTREQLEQEVQERTRELTGTADELTAQISLRRSTEEALNRSEEMFRRFADHSRELIYFYRLLPERQCEFMSPAATELTGYTPEEHYANPDLGLQIVHADDRHLLQSLSSNDADFSRPLVLRWVRKDGRVIWTEQHIIPIRDAAGQLIAIQGVARDITDRVRTEEKLRESERFLQTIIETEPECVKLLARDGTLLLMNRAGLDMIDAERLDQVKGQPICRMVLPPYRQEFMRIAEEAFQGRTGKYTFEAVGLKGRHIWLETHVAPLRNEKNEIIAALAITREVTEHVRSEQILRNIAEHISTKTGEAFFRAVTKFITRELGTDVAFIGESIEGGNTIRTIALYVDGAYGEDFEYSVAGTPCENVIGKTSCFYADNIQTLFPRDNLLVTMGLVSYAGIPLVDSAGTPTGGLVTLGRSPLQAADRDRIINLLQIFASRVTAELERRRMDSALRASEQRYRQLLESITSYIYTVAVKNGRAVATTHGSACQAVTGYRAEEFAAEPFLWYQMIHEADKSAVLAQAAVVLAGGRPQPLEHRILHKNGTVVWVRNSIAPRVDAEGVLVAYDGIIEDITERKQTETLVKSIMDSVDEGFLIIDRSMNIVTANRAFLSACGLPLDQVVGRKCYEVSHRIDHPCYERGEDCVVRSALENGESRTAVHTHHDPQGKPVFIETKAFPLRTDSGEIVAAIEVVNNITERKRLEDQLRHSQKMEAVGLLAGGISHDFNNILTAIVGYANLLKLKTPAGDPRLGYAEQVLAAAARAANLTQSLLTFSRKQVINPQPMDANDAIRRIEKLLLRIIGEDIDLRTDLAAGPLSILADPSQVEQVLMNLVTNARDAMPNGGELTLRTGTGEIDEEFRQAHGFGIPGTYVCIEVADEGVGMNETQMAHIFEPFYTSKAPGKGTGLGLAIVYGIMKQNKGYVLVRSETGKGTVFSLYFPLIESAVLRKEDEAPATSEEGSETILVAEDDETLRRLTATMLAEFGYSVIQAEDGEDAIEKFRQHADRVDLAILDVVMPRRGGKDVHDEMVRIKPAIKVLYLSGYDAEVLSAKGISVSAANCILKPVSPMDLLRAVRRALDANGDRDEASSRSS